MISLMINWYQTDQSFRNEPERAKYYLLYQVISVIKKINDEVEILLKDFAIKNTVYTNL